MTSQTVTIERSKLELALEALEDMHIVDFPLEDLCNWNKAITAIKEALAQPEQERNFCSRCGKRFGSNDWDVHTCTPPQPEQEPVVVMELYTVGWDLVENIDNDWLESLPFGTKLYAHPPVPTAQSKEPEQEPAWYHAECNDPDHSGFFKEAIDAVTQVNEHGGFVTKLYTTPPQRNPLTELQVRKIASSLRSGFTWFEFAQAIEAASTTTANPSNHVGFEKLSGEFSTAVSEPEQEPVANGYVFVAISILEKLGINKAVIDTIATTPPQRKPLGYVDLRRIANQCGLGANEVSARTQATVDNFARAIEATHGIKE